MRGRWEPLSCTVPPSVSAEQGHVVPAGCGDLSQAQSLSQRHSVKVTGVVKQQG